MEFRNELGQITILLIVIHPYLFQICFCCLQVTSSHHKFILLKQQTTARTNRITILKTETCIGIDEWNNPFMLLLLFPRFK